ncbi:efflux transporter outer membrane subunit [Sphingomonas naphthae]|uniref:Efflux transporter outer membrane subunit n=1 Tax=Sphingomonas naphthae TaxID=1813468 RepID=A0ABY7TGV8_9SPHN|nr:efflux transporter outer membrane subunit [Sphingomonas naphthae]WCT72395.1 efflux transporter outer membrane subunit [Sphingomonas naphthae]
MRRAEAAVRRLLGAGGLLALAGCSMAPHYAAPVTAAPAAYKGDGATVATGWIEASPQDGAVRGAWWSRFRDPVLDDLEARIEAASPTLAAALARYDAARAQVRGEAADLFPQIGVGASIERERLSARRPLAQNGAAKYTDRVIAGTADYEVDLWGRVRNSVAAARADAAASKADLANVRLSLQAQLADAYFRLRGLDATRQLLERSVSAFTRAHDLTVTRHDGGIANGLDVNRAATLLSAARAQISSVEADRVATENEIAALVGAVASDFRIAPAILPLTPPLVPAEAPSALIQRRPDVAEAERRIAAANARIGVARAAWFPQVTLGAGGGWNSTAGALISTPASFWALGPAQALLALFDGGRRAANVRISRAQYDEAAADYRRTVLAAFAEVEDSIAAARLLAQQSVDQREAAAAASRTEQLALTRYRDGASDYLDVVTAQTAALDSERAALAVQTQRMRAAVALVRALGGDYREG